MILKRLWTILVLAQFNGRIMGLDMNNALCYCNYVYMHELHLANLGL